MLQSQSQPPKLLDQVRTAIRTRHYSIRTEATYLPTFRTEALILVNFYR
jgi:hypothetical protein